MKNYQIDIIKRDLSEMLRDKAWANNITLNQSTIDLVINSAVDSDFIRNLIQYVNDSNLIERKTQYIPCECDCCDE